VLAEGRAAALAFGRLTGHGTIRLLRRPWQDVTRPSSPPDTHPLGLDAPRPAKRVAKHHAGVAKPGRDVPNPDAEAPDIDEDVRNPGAEVPDIDGDMCNPDGEVPGIDGDVCNPDAEAAEVGGGRSDLDGEVPGVGRHLRHPDIAVPQAYAIATSPGLNWPRAAMTLAA